jgi:hypothetical protein
VTRPEVETLAIDVLFTDQVVGLPEMTAPFASFATAVACEVPPTVTLLEDTLTLTVATTGEAGAVTLTLMVPVLPAPAAVIVADPAPTAETSPLLETLATAAFDVVHVNVVPLTVAPLASFATAEACVVPPTARLLVAGDTAIDATVVVVPATVNVANPFTPPLVTLRRVDPALTAVTNPVAETLITVEFSEA